MGFYAKNFVYDGQSSEMYNLQIANIDDSTANKMIDSPGSGKIDILEQFIYRRAIPYFYGIHYKERLSFTVQFFSPDEITALSLSYIQYWLFGNKQYKSLALIQPDTDDIYLNCIFSEPKILRAGNIIYGIEAKAECDSQFAYTYSKTLTYNYPTNPSGSLITFFNNSHLKDYMYPQMTFIMDSNGGNFSILNSTDNNRLFSFTGLQPLEVMTINNDLGIISSSLGVLRLSNFNKYFFRFAPGINNIYITGDITQLTFTYQFLRRFGG